MIRPSTPGSGWVEARDVGPGVTIAFADEARARAVKEDVALMSPLLRTLLPGMEGQMAAVADDTGRVVVPFTVRFPDGATMRGQSVVAGHFLRDPLEDALEEVTKGPVTLEGDEVEPAPAAPRAMWIAHGGVTPALMGGARSPSEIDWVLVIDERRGSISCRDGLAQDVLVGVRGRVFERRTGKLIGERSFPIEDPPCALGITTITASRHASWALNVLRHRRPR